MSGLNPFCIQGLPIPGFRARLWSVCVGMGSSPISRNADILLKYPEADTMAFCVLFSDIKDDIHLWQEPDLSYDTFG